MKMSCGELMKSFEVMLLIVVLLLGATTVAMIAITIYAWTH